MQSKKSLYNVVKHVLDLKKHHEGQSLGFPQQKISMKQYHLTCMKSIFDLSLPHDWWIYKTVNVVIIKNKSQSLTAFIKNWLSTFGAPKRLFSDNGGEFISDKFYEIKVYTNLITSF